MDSKAKKNRLMDFKAKKSRFMDFKAKKAVLWILNRRKFCFMNS